MAQHQIFHVSGAPYTRIKGITLLDNNHINLMYFVAVKKRLWHALRPGGGGGVLPYISYIGMCGPKGYGFQAILV